MGLEFVELESSTDFAHLLITKDRFQVLMLKVPLANDTLTILIPPESELTYNAAHYLTELFGDRSAYEPWIYLYMKRSKHNGLFVISINDSVESINALNRTLSGLVCVDASRMLIYYSDKFKDELKIWEEMIFVAKLFVENRIDSEELFRINDVYMGKNNADNETSFKEWLNYEYECFYGEGEIS